MMRDQITKHSTKQLEAKNEEDDNVVEFKQAVVQNDENIVFIGDYLRTLRIEKNVDIIIIARSTRINISILRALEGNKFDELPNIAYLKGFVKSYVRELGGNLDHALEVLEDTCNYFRPPVIEEEEELEEQEFDTSEQVVQSINKVGKTFSHIPTRYYKLAGAIFVFVSLAFLLSKGISSLKDEMDSAKVTTAEPVKEEPVKAQTPAAAIEEKLEETQETNVKEENSNIEVKPVAISAEEATEQVKAADKIEVKKEVAPKKEGPAQSIMDEIKPAVVKKVEVLEEKESTLWDTPLGTFSKKYSFSEIKIPMYQLQPDAEENKDEEILKPRFKHAVIAGLQNVFITSVDGDTWMRYKKDDDEIKTFTLRKGRSVLIRGKRIRLFIGNTENIKVFLNNTLLKILTSNGVKSMVFPESAAKDYRTPLFIRTTAGDVIASDKLIEALN